MSSTRTRTRARRGLRAGLAVLALAAGTMAFAPAAFAQTDSGGDQQTPQEQTGEGQDQGRPRHPQLTEEQQACLEAAGVEKPAEGERPTEEQRDAFRAAAEGCGIELPQRLTDEQKACLEAAGVEKPAEGTELTEEQREARRAAAEQCGVEPRHGHRPKLTDEQKACLEAAGVEKPAEGERPTDEQREAFRAAAEGCGIELPERPADGEQAPDDAPEQDGTADDSENQSTSV